MLKKIYALALALCMLLTCTACGGGGDEYDPNVGIWNAVSATMYGMEMSVTDLFEDGVALELNGNGKAKLTFDGDSARCKWSYENGEFILSGSDIDCPGTIENGVLTLTNLLNMGVDMTFEKEGGYSAAQPGAAEGAGEEKAGEGKEAAGASRVQELWNGTWYGCLYVSTAIGTFSDIPELSDVYMVVDVDENGEGTFKVYLANVDEAFVAGDCTAWYRESEDETGLDAKNGTIAGMQDINISNWTFRHRRDYTDTFCILDDIEEGERGKDGKFSYSIYVKQWGHSWQYEIDDGFDLVPPALDDYEAAIAAGEQPPVGFAPIGYAQQAPVPGAEAPAPAAPKAEEASKAGTPAEGDYGKTTPDATGIVDFDTLKSGFTWLHHSTGSEGGYLRPTYEEIAEKMGGVNAMKTHESSWEDDYHVYIWQTEGKKDFLLLSFKVQPDGSETWNSSSWSNGLND